MIFDDQIEKIELLINHKKFDIAQTQIQQLLIENADNDYLYYLLSNIKYQQSLLKDALTFIDKSIELSPDLGFYYYFKACIKLANENYHEVEDLLLTAIRIDPEIAEYKAQLSQFKLLKKNYTDALEIANQALELDPENILALNTRSTALLKLNRKEESFETIEGALREDPENSYTHSNYGWGLLEKGNNKKALEHFRESLKNNPNNSHAQAGMVEALKADNFIYRWYLKYVFFMEKLTEKNQWFFIIGFYIASKLLRSVAKHNQTLEPFLTPLIILLAIFAFSTWVITPLSNLLFRINPYGKYLLSKEEKISSNFVGISFCIFLIGIVTYFATNKENFIPVALFGFLMMVPLGSLFIQSKVKYLPIIISIILTLLGLLAIAMTILTNNLINLCSILFFIIFIVYQWLTNFFIIKSGNI